MRDTTYGWGEPGGQSANSLGELVCAATLHAMAAPTRRSRQMGHRPNCTGSGPPRLRTFRPEACKARVEERKHKQDQQDRGLWVVVGEAL